MVKAIAAVGSTGGVVQCEPGAVIDFGSSPLLIANKSYLTLDLTGVEIRSTANISYTQLYQPALIYLKNCSDCLVKGKALIKVNGFANSALGLESCTNCDVEHLIAQGCKIGFGQFFSVGGKRCAWRYCDALNGQATARGFWLGGAQSTWGETDLEVLGCRAIGNAGTGIAVGSNGAKIIGNTSTDNGGAGICSGSTGDGSVSSYHTIANNDCRRNTFWGWQSDVWNGSQLFNTTVSGNLFDGNTAGAALLNACTTIMYGSNIDNGIVQVCNCTGGKVQLGPQATLHTNGGPNTNVVFS
ncbi:MAG: hypothetical protein WDO72_13740 [Pseudomonadota bacterium]